MLYGHGAGISTPGNGTGSLTPHEMDWFSPSSKGLKSWDTAYPLRGCNTGRNEWEKKMQSCCFC